MKLIETFLINFFSLIFLLQHHKGKNYLFGQRHLEPRFPLFAWCLQEDNKKIIWLLIKRETERSRKKKERGKEKRYRLMWKLDSTTVLIKSKNKNILRIRSNVPTICQKQKQMNLISLWRLFSFLQIVQLTSVCNTCYLHQFAPSRSISLSWTYIFFITFESSSDTYDCFLLFEFIFDLIQIK